MNERLAVMFEVASDALQKGRRLGIVDGLCMAADMLKNRKRREWGHQVPIDGFDFYQELLAKAKEVEEGKGEK